MALNDGSQTKRPPNHEPAKTGGEILFDRLAYDVIGGVGTMVLSVGITKLANDKTLNSSGKMNPLARANSWVQNKSSDAAERFITDDNGTFQEIANKIRNDDSIKGQTLFDPNHKDYNPQQFFYNQWSAGNQNSFDALATNIGHSAADVENTRDYFVNLNRAKSISLNFATGMFLGSGGFLTMIPIKLMEDHKLEITQFLDEKVLDPMRNSFGKAAATNYELEARQERYDHIRTSKQQSWGSLLGSRLATLVYIVPAYTAVAGEDNIIKSALKPNNQKYVNPNPKVGFGGVEHHAKAMTDTIADKALSYDAISSHISEKDFKEGAKILALDGLLTIIASQSTYAFTRVLGPLIGKEPDVAENNNIVDISQTQQDEQPDIKPHTNVKNIEPKGVTQSTTEREKKDITILA